VTVAKPGFDLRLGTTDRRTFAELGELYRWGCTQPEGAITVDCSSMPFCGGNLAAALRAVQQQLAAINRPVSYGGMKPAVGRLLADAGLFGAHRRQLRGTVIPLTPFAAGESARFALYSQRGLTDKGLPGMSARLKSRVFEGIDELFTNFEIHSRSRLGAYACGQLFPSAGRLEFTFVDLGIGIPAVVNSAGHALTPAHAIDWAMSGNNTTRSGDVPGGLGLKVLREFISLNQGSLVIASHGGFWSEKAGQRVMNHLASPFPGTAVTISVNTNDRNSYRLSDDIQPKDVF